MLAVTLDTLTVVTGCGGGHHAPGGPAVATAPASPQATSARSRAANSTASVNERVFADGISAPIPVVPARVVAGAPMRAYIRYQHADGAALAAVGHPGPSDSVSQIAGGFKLCWPDTGSGAGCDAFTQFTTDHGGRITGVSVNGQPVAGRIATGPSATSGGLTISGVVSYRATDAQNLVAVAFKLTDHSYRPVNTSPALLASLSGASNDASYAGLPANLAPGDTLYAEVAFDVARTSGLFCLQPNDGSGEHLPCTALTKG